VRMIRLQVGMSWPVRCLSAIARNWWLFLLRFRGRIGHSVTEECPVPVMGGLGFKSPREKWVSRSRRSTKSGEAQGDVEDGG
jgi:hypothetical protein